jgi:hypothetical protein
MLSRLTGGSWNVRQVQELEKKIKRYRRPAFSINDQLTIDRCNQLIKDAEAEKARLHPDQQR